MNDLIKWTSGHCKFTRTGATFNKNIGFLDWAKIGRSLKEVTELSIWAIGDWVNAGEDLFSTQYGTKFRIALELTGYEYGTLRNIASVCRRIDLSRRRDNLSFSHHADVVALKPKDQDKFLNLAIENEWSCSELRQAMRKAFATEHEEGGKGGALGFVLNKWTGDFMRWFGVQLKHTPLDDWSPDRCKAVLHELQPISDAIQVLKARTEGRATPRKESITATTPHR